MANVWKFGYGSNISPEFVRTKKNLNVLDYRRCVLKGFALSFPAGRGIDYIEPCFATLRKDQHSEVHGTCLLLPAEDGKKLDNQEGSYDVEAHECEIYPEDDSVENKHILSAEVYCPRRAEPEGNPQGPCSKRYRNILVDGAKLMKLDSNWIEKLQNLAFYTPNEATLVKRAELPIFEKMSGVKEMTISELKKFNGSDENLPIYTAVCGYIFEDKPFFKIYWGRDVTYRQCLQRRGISLDLNDTGGVSPFPKLTELKEKEPEVLEYCLQQRDRMFIRSGKVVGVLKEFWDDQ